MDLKLQTVWSKEEGGKLSIKKDLGGHSSESWMGSSSEKVLSSSQRNDIPQFPPPHPQKMASEISQTPEKNKSFFAVYNLLFLSRIIPCRNHSHSMKNGLETRQTQKILILSSTITWTYVGITHICRIKGCGGAGWPPHQ